MNRQFLYDMLTVPAFSGHEKRLQNVIADHMKDYAHQMVTDEIDDLVCVLNPDHPVKILLAAHADEIGLVVTDIAEDGFLTVAKSGGIYCDTYPGQKVRVCSGKGVVYGSVLHHGSLWEKKERTPSDLLIDIGAASAKEASQWVSPGDVVVFDTDYRELLGNRLTARALDDRIGIFCIMEALKQAAGKGCRAGIYCASTVGEETSKNGAYWVSRQVEPARAIVVDVTGTSDYRKTERGEFGNIRLGGGPVLLHHPLSHRKMTADLAGMAAEGGIPVQFEVGAGRTCTDADQIHFSNHGVPTAVVSIPLRYMHTPGEVCDMGDVENCINLLAEMLCRIE